jgi:hypothetical protein
MKKTKSKDTVIVGIVVPAIWNEKGQVTGTAINTFDEKEYIVEKDRYGRVLIKLLQKRVEVTGKIREQLDGKKIIRIQTVKSLSNSDQNQLCSL